MFNIIYGLVLLETSMSLGNSIKFCTQLYRINISGTQIIPFQIKIIPWNLIYFHLKWT